MKSLSFRSTYFAIRSPVEMLKRWVNPYRYTETVDFRGKPLAIFWTQRAQRQLELRDNPLIVEMQLYFTCVVKKRVLFHEEFLDAVTIVNDLLSISFHPVEASSCDAVEFSKKFPVKRALKTSAANKMRPGYLYLDYDAAQWLGRFGI